MVSVDLDDLPGVELGTMPERCLACEQYVIEATLYRQLRVCPHCRFHHTISSWRYIAALADRGTFNESPPLIRIDPTADGADAVDGDDETEDALATDEPEAVITGTCEIDGVKCVVILLNFSVAGGNVNVFVGEKIARSFEWAKDRKLPCVTIVTASGERSAEEGIMAMLQMIKTVSAARAVAKSNLPYIAVLGNPCNGAPFASFINQADIVLAEPGARIGFASFGDIRGVAQARGRKKDKDSELQYDAEKVADWGQIDRVVDREFLRREVGSLLRITTKRDQIIVTADGEVAPAELGEAETAQPEPPIAVEKILKTKRAVAGLYLEALFTDWIELKRHRVDDASDAIVCGFGKLSNAPVAIIAVNNAKWDTPSPITTSGLMKAIHLARLADKFALPIITLVDSCYPALGLEHEQQGIAKAISHTIATLGEVETPVIAAVLGIVGSETSLALGIADRIAMVQGAGYILDAQFGTPAKAENGENNDLSGELYLSPQECRELGIADTIIMGEADAKEAQFVAPLRDYLIGQVADLGSAGGSKLAQARVKRFRDVDSDYTTSEARLKRRWEAWQAGFRAAAKSIRATD